MRDWQGVTLRHIHPRRSPDAFRCAHFSDASAAYVLAFWCLHGTAPRYLAETLHLTNNRSRLRSAATSTLIVPATQRRTLGDRRFPAAAARAWNSLPSFIRDQQSLAAFQQQLKTVLFRTSFGEDANSWAASLLTRDCLVFVRWPCNVLCVIMPP